MIIDHDNKFVFVAVAKTACTSIHRSFGYNRDPSPSIYHMHLKDIIKTNPQVKDYFKFGFVRNPYDRLVSAYHDFKYSEGHQSWAYPIQKYRTFKEFALDLSNGPCKDWIHLRPQFEYLEIDNKLGADFVGRFEYLNKSFLMVQGLLNIPARTLGNHRTSSHEQYETYYDEETKNAVYEFYKKDFEEFQYER